MVKTDFKNTYEVNLGQSRLRTETAAMVAVMMMHLSAGE